MLSESCPSGTRSAFPDRWKRARELIADHEPNADHGTRNRDLIAELGGGVRLWRYSPEAPGGESPPVVIAYSLVGGIEILDLEPDRSFVADLLPTGRAIYLIDWGKPSRAHRLRGLEDYVLGFLGDAVDVARSTERARQVALVGICEGGIMAACYAALEPSSVERLGLVVTPVDFHVSSGPYGRHRLLDEDSIADLETLLTHLGAIPGDLIAFWFQSLILADTLTRSSLSLVARVADRPDEVRAYLQMERWLASRLDHPATLSMEILRDLIVENRFARCELDIGRERVDLGELQMPILNVFAAHDHIVPPESARALAAVVRTGCYTESELPTGHIGALVSRGSRRAGPAIARWLLEDRVGEDR